jgi:uncharacterized protein (DUF2062 family)
MDGMNALPRVGWLRRRVGQPLVALFRQGGSPEKIAQCVVVGSVLSVFPLLGATSILCTVAAVKYRLNLPAIHAVNWLMTGAHLLLIIPFLRVGEWVTHSEPLILSVGQIKSALGAGVLSFFELLGVSMLRAILGWCITAAPLAFIVYRAMVPALRRRAARLAVR